MAGVRAELLMLLTWILLLVPVQGWERIDGPQFISLLESGQLGEHQSLTSTWTDDNSDFNSEDTIPEEGEGDFDSDGDFDSEDDGEDGFQVVSVDGNGWDGIMQSESHTEIFDAPPSSWASSPSSSGLDVVCSATGFQITLPTGSLSDVKVLGSAELLSVMNAPESCGYEVDTFQKTLTVPFTGCNVKHTDGYSLHLLYTDEFGDTQVATASCEESFKFDSALVPRSSGQPKPKSKCPNQTTAPTTTSPSKASNCAVPSGERVTCGQSGISSLDCTMMGCCMDYNGCYYPMDECTADQHFVFAIRSNSASTTVDPTKLVIPGHPNCKPVIVNDNVAIFKFRVTECGARAYQVGETKIYLAEVQTVVQALNLKYGAITRTDPLRFMVECRYGKSGSGQSLASVGYMVKLPVSDMPSSIIDNGLYGVQLRIGKDQTYSSYFPTYHQPLRMLLGKPVYLELRLKSPKPDAVILVNYCLAFPRSAKNALVLVYEGCANPYDPRVSILKISGDPKNRHQRRFIVNAFQFMDQRTNKYLDEEIYFMCSSEVCRPGEKTCAERCFDGKA